MQTFGRGLSLALLLLALPVATFAASNPTQTTLTATKTVDVLTVSQQGGQIVYGVHVTNTGSTTAKSVVIGDNIPANATFVSTLPGCSFQPGSVYGRGIVVCVPQDVAPGQTIATQVIVRADANLPCGTQIVNVADVQADNAPLLWSNKVMTTVTCDSPTTPTLTIKKTVNLLTIPQSGGQLIYGIHVTNTGTGVARGVVMGDNIPANTTFVSTLPGCNFQPGSAFGRGIVVCVPQDVAPGATIATQVIVKVDAGLACNTQITNVADVDAANLPSNWSNKVMTRVDCPTVSKPTPTPTPTTTPTPTPEVKKEVKKGIDVSKTDHRDITRPGHSLTYVITIHNTSNIDLSDIKVTDNVPGQLTVTSISHGGTRAGRDITWTGISLEAGAKKEVTFTATVKAETIHGHLLVNDVKACSADHDLCDTATDTTRVERAPQVAAAKIVHVPVTAKTGAGMIGIVSTLLGSLGLYAVSRKGF